jgi:hypothetical protein
VLTAACCVAIAAVLIGAGVAGLWALDRADRRPAEPTVDRFAQVRGWIAYRSGSGIMAVDPANPSLPLVIGLSEGAEPIAWSPDGTALLLRSGVGLQKSTYPLDLTILHADGARTGLVHDDGRRGSPPFATWGSFSPDGRRVAYACCGSSRGPFVIEADGGEPRALGDRCPREEIQGRSVELCGEPLPEAAAWSRTIR